MANTRRVLEGSPRLQDRGRTLLGRLVEFAVGLEVEVDIDQVGSSKKLDSVSTSLSPMRGSPSYLEHHPRRDDG